MNSYPWIINLIHKVRSVPCCFRPDSRASAIEEQALHFEAAHVSLLSTHPCPVQKNRRSKLGKEKEFLVSAQPRMRACSAATPIFSSRPFPLRNKTFCGEGKMRRHPERTDGRGRGDSDIAADARIAKLVHSPPTPLLKR